MVHPRVAVGLTLLLLAAPATAAAAQIQVDRPCYADPGERRDQIALSGTGFDPDATYQVTLDGQPLAGGSSTTDAGGNLSGAFSAPAIATVSRIAHQHAFVLGVQEGANAPTTTFTVSRLFASFRPSAGNPGTLKVRFSLYGFALQGQLDAPVYVHYVRPDGRLQESVRLGAAGGVCGFLRTGHRRLFPFDAIPGAWRLQFDARKGYTPGRKDSSFLFYTLGVKVRSG